MNYCIFVCGAAEPTSAPLKKRAALAPTPNTGFKDVCRIRAETDRDRRNPRSRSQRFFLSIQPPK